MSRERFLEILEKDLLLLSQHLKSLLRLGDDPDLPEEGHVLVSGSLIHWLAGANTIPGVRGTLALVDDVLMIRLALGRLADKSPESVERHLAAEPELLEGLTDKVALIREELGAGAAVFDAVLDRIGDLKHKGHTARECATDDEAATLLYEEVQAALVDLELDEMEISRELKGLQKALDGLRQR